MTTLCVRSRATIRGAAIGRNLELITTGPEQTKQVAGTVAAAIVPGDVIALTGEIGAGKTCFVQGAAAALGVSDRVTSPSFILRKEYQGSGLRVLHLDVYRLDSLQEVLDVGFDGLGDDCVTFVEWGDAMAPLLPHDHLEVELRLPVLDDQTLDSAAAASDFQPEPRTLILTPHGHGWARRLNEARPALKPWMAEEG